MHEVQQYDTGLGGVEAVSLKSTHHFPRHSHDQFGIGFIQFGGHRSWSSIGSVEAICGDVIMVNPGEMHDGASLDGNARHWSMLFFEPDLVRSAFSDSEQNLSVPLKPVVRDHQLAAEFRQLFAAATSQPAECLRHEECLLKTLSFALRHRCGDPHRAEDRPPKAAITAQIAKVVRLIDSAPQCSLSLHQMAQLAGISRFHFLRAFAHLTGATPHAYVVQQRVRLARRLLAAGKDPTEAALEAGFADQSHLTRAFVRQIGVTPARYRRIIRAPRR